MNGPAFQNPCGLDGFAFLEFSGPDNTLFHSLFTQLGFACLPEHPHPDIHCYQQGGIPFIVNGAGDGQPAEHANQHGAGISAMGFKVADATHAYRHALKHGATPFEDTSSVNHHLLGIEAIGGSVIYFVDDEYQPFQGCWKNARIASTNGLEAIDHLTHNVQRGNMDKWADFYARIFNFREIRYFDIEGKMTGLLSRALASPCNKIKIPLNESKDDKSQIEEFLHAFHGEGIQHVALSTAAIYDTVSHLRRNGMAFLNVPDTYYEMLGQRLPWHQEPLAALQQEKILMDGGVTPDDGLLLQIFTENLFGPVFFEIIQRKGNEGFGEGNFQALFEAIERDQIKRGTLSE